MKFKLKTILGVIFLMLIYLNLISALSIESLVIRPDEIMPGENVFINMVLKNDGDLDAKNVIVSVDITNFPFKARESPEISFNKIREGRQEVAGFTVTALTNAQSGVYKIPVKITYADEEGKEFEKNSILTISINSPLLLDLRIGDGLILKGEDNELTIRVTNKGLGDAKFLELGLQESPSYDIISSNKIYIGDVDSDDFESADFDIYIKGTAPNSLNLPVILKYRDILNNDYSESILVNIRTYSRQDAAELGLINNDNTLTIVFAVVAVILIYIIYRIIRKKRRKKKIEE